MGMITVLVVSCPCALGIAIPLTRSVGIAAVLAFYDGSGRGAMTLWPLFGATNQLLAGLAPLVVTVYLARRKAPLHYTAIPMVFMLVMTGWAMLINLGDYFSGGKRLLFCIGIVTLVLEIWMLAESALILKTTLAAEGAKKPSAMTSRKREEASV